MFENATVFAASLAPQAWAPAVTTYTTLLLQVAVVVQIVWLCRAYQLSPLAQIGLVLCWALLPATIEVWMSATNAQWIAGVSAFFPLVMPPEWVKRYRVRAASWLVFCGLSGIPATILAPIALLQAGFSKQRRSYLFALVLGAVALFQLHLVFWFPIGQGRIYPSDAISLLVPTLLQTVLAPLFTPDFASVVAEAVQRGDPLTTLGMAVLSLGVVALAVAAAHSEHFKTLVPVTMLAWSLVSVVQTFGAIGVPLHGRVGARYFLFGSICMCLLWAFGTCSMNKALARISTIALLVSIVVSTAFLISSPVSSYYLAGPSWRAQVENCPVGTLCRIQIWPATDWFIVIPRK
jgi:hypothetical protein